MALEVSPEYQFGPSNALETISINAINSFQLTSFKLPKLIDSPRLLLEKSTIERNMI